MRLLPILIGCVIDMDWLTFTAKLIEVLAWPVATMVLVALLRTEIRGLLPMVKRLKAGPLEAEFEKELKDLRSSAEAQLPKQEQSKEATPSTGVLLQLVQISPRSAVLEAWQQLEAAALRVAIKRQLNLTPAESVSPLAVVRTMNHKGLISAEELTLFHDLRALRNQAAHSRDFSPTTEAALNYIELTSRLRQTFEQASSLG